MKGRLQENEARRWRREKPLCDSSGICGEGVWVLWLQIMVCRQRWQREMNLRELSASWEAGGA